MKNVNSIIMLLEGRNRDLIDTLQKQMAEAAQSLDFERAATLRDQIGALSRTLEKQVIAASHNKNQDVFGFARKDAAVTIAILFIRNGLINGSRTFFLADPYGDDQSILSQVIGQFYDRDSILPGEILLPFAPADMALLTEHLNDVAESIVHVKVPQRGDLQNLVAMATTNALQLFEEKEKKSKSWDHLGETLQKTLQLSRVPSRIECLDISNIGGKQPIGSLVSFFEGEKDPANFRHYHIKSLDIPNDYAMMKEVLERRLRRGIAENNLPDLFVVDGGKGQLGIALAVGKELGIVDDIDWLGIAKERQDEGEKLYKPNRKNPLVLPAYNPVLLFLMRIRDEAHRYGVTFHRKIRRKVTLASDLDRIPGIGAAKKKALLRHMGSLKRIKEAAVAELREVPGIGVELATEISNYFNREPQDNGNTQERHE